MTPPAPPRPFLTRLLWLALVLLAGTGIVAWTTAPIFFDPNGTIFMVGGDGFIISWHLQWFTRFGEGLTLNDMNYPIGELIFMTDAQAVLALSLRFIHQWWPEIAGKVLGIQNGLLLYTAPLAGLFLYLLLRRLDIPAWRAVLYALILFAMLPQWDRLVNGHFGLGYLWILPLILWWMVRYLQGAHRWRDTVILTAVLALFGLNNPYLILICGSFFLSFMVVVFISRRHRDVCQPALPLMLISFLPLGLVLGVVKGLDTVGDRVKQPWGFFDHVAQFESLFYPQRGPIHDTIDQIATIATVSWEGTAYTGLTVTLFLLVFLGRWIQRIVAKRPHAWTTWTSDTTLNLLFWSTIPVLLFAVNILNLPGLREIPELLPVLYQFRAPGRFVWVFVLVFSILAAVLGDRWLIQQSHSSLGRIGTWLIWGILVAFWGYEGYIHLHLLKQQPVYDSPFEVEKLDQRRQELTDAGITPETVQAIYFVPALTGWTDKLVKPDVWLVEYHGYQTALATGIPLLTAKLSRMSLSQAAATVQWIAHPWLERPGFAAFPNERDLLLVTAQPETWSEGEQWLVKQASPVLEKEDWSIHRLSAPLDRQSVRKEVNLICTRSQPDSTSWYFLDHFEDQALGPALSGNASLQTSPGWDTLAVVHLPDGASTGSYECSTWLWLEPRRFGMPVLHVNQYRDDGTWLNSSTSGGISWGMDLQDDWLRAAFTFARHPECRKMVFFTDYPAPCRADALLIKPVGDTLCLPDPILSDRHWLNNYPLSSK